MAQLDEDSGRVVAARRGDRSAFRELVESHADAVFAFLHRTVGNPDAAEELAQETFVRAHAGLAGFRGEARFRTWLLQIALNLARDRRRAAGRGPRIVSLDEFRERNRSQADPPDADPRSDPARALERRDLSRRLESALSRLPADYREAFLLRHVEGLSYRELARVTGDSVGALKVRVHRARARLRETLTRIPAPGPAIRRARSERRGRPGE